MIPVWPQYYDTCSALLYVLNVACIGSLAESIIQLGDVLQHPRMQVLIMHAAEKSQLMFQLLLQQNASDAQAVRWHTS